MTAEERAERKADAQRKAGRTVSASAEVAERKAAAKAKDDDLDDPQTQAKIEMPKTIEMVLHLPEGSKAALISTEFTHADVYDANLFEDLQSFSVMLSGELRLAQYRPEGEELLISALTSSRMRAAVRRILSIITRYEQPWLSFDANGREIRHDRPTEDEMRRGIIIKESGLPNLALMYQYAMILFGMFQAEAERQKNARVAADPA